MFGMHLMLHTVSRNGPATVHAHSLTTLILNFHDQKTSSNTYAAQRDAVTTCIPTSAAANRTTNADSHAKRNDEKPQTSETVTQPEQPQVRIAYRLPVIVVLSGFML